MTGSQAQPEIDRLLDSARMPGKLRELLDRGHMVFRRYLTAEIMLGYAADRRRVLVELAAEREAEIDSVLEPNRRRLAPVFLSCTDEQISMLFDYFERATPALLAAAEELQSHPE